MTSTPGRKKVLIDARMMSPIPHGIGRYVQDLLEGLDAKDRPYDVVALVSGGNHRFNTIRTVSSSVKFLSAREILELPLQIRRLGVDAFHSPSFSSPRGVGISTIVTIHDLNHLYFGSAFQRAYYRRWVRPFALSAAQICTVSESSRQEIADWLGIENSRIEVVSNAIRRGEKSVIPMSLARGKYFLCVTNPKAHKNLDFLIRAYQMAREALERMDRPVFSLALTIDPLPRHQVPGVVYLGAVSEEVLESLYERAAVVLAPSLYEGFGRTPVEALVRGVPVRLSRITSHEEIVRDLPIGGYELIHPTDLDGWVNALLRAQTEPIMPVDPLVSERLLSEFSQENLVKRMDQIYRRVLGLVG